MFWISSCLLLTVASMSRTFKGLVLWCPEAANVISRAQSLLKHLANILRQNDIRSLACLASGDGCGLALILALTVAVVLIARNQHERMLVTIGEQSQAGDCPAFIDRESHRQLHTGAGRRKRIQVDERAVLPEECVRVGAQTVIVRFAHDLPLCIDGIRHTAEFPLNDTQVGHAPQLPEKPMHGLIARSSGPPDNIFGLADAVCRSEISSQCAEVTHFSSSPEKRMKN